MDLFAPHSNRKFRLIIKASLLCVIVVGKSPVYRRKYILMYQLLLIIVYKIT